MRRWKRWQKVTFWVIVALIAIGIIQLILSGGGHDTSAEAATRYPHGLPRCTKAAHAKKRCTKKQANKVMAYGRRGHDSKPRTLRQRRPPLKTQAHSASSACRTWRPRIKRIARAGEIYWRGATIHWCFNWNRVTSARVITDADVTTLGRFLGFDHISTQEPVQGYYNWNGHKNGGYLLYQRFVFEQCIPVIQFGPFCNDRKGWFKVFGHYDGSGHASGNAP
ncbi:MAG: hypothetical protein QOF36_2593 [Microbacteriaceae bacterium]|jgi:hypothetical protein|nr:hypothetical protein [Microbacteriaceae bacterium]